MRVPELTGSIENYLKNYNAQPKLFIWTASVDSILVKLQKLEAVYETLRSQADTLLALLPPVFESLLGGLVQPILVIGQTDHLERRKSPGRIRGRIARRCQPEWCSLIVVPGYGVNTPYAFTYWLI